jgi:hypothetical protein
MGEPIHANNNTAGALPYHYLKQIVEQLLPVTSPVVTVF